jgi:hypothetical protein
LTGRYFSKIRTLPVGLFDYQLESGSPTSALIPPTLIYWPRPGPRHNAIRLTMLQQSCRRSTHQSASIHGDDPTMDIGYFNKQWVVMHNCGRRCG